MVKSNTQQCNNKYHSLNWFFNWLESFSLFVLALSICISFTWAVSVHLFALRAVHIGVWFFIAIFFFFYFSLKIHSHIWEHLRQMRFFNILLQLHTCVCSFYLLFISSTLSSFFLSFLFGSLLLVQCAQWKT